MEIPVFNNVILDFRAKKDFSKYLDEFEIREHKFKYYVPKRYKKKARKKREINEWLWYARWYFSQKPETGNLEVLFK